VPERPGERDAIATVSSFTSGSPLAARWPIKLNRGTNYTTLHLGSVRKWFLKLQINGRGRVTLITDLPVKEAAALAGKFETDSPPSNIGTSRIVCDSVKDLPHLGALIRAAYDRRCSHLDGNGG
jgi:hypothetical protein